MTRIATAALAAMFVAPLATEARPTLDDAQIAHIAFTADAVDIASAKLALQKTTNPKVREFAQEMVRDQTALNHQALALFQKLNITPAPNDTSASLDRSSDAKRRLYASLTGAAFDRTYVQSEVAYHRTVNAALRGMLIPDAKNPELKNLLQVGLQAYQAHQAQAEQLAAQLG
jgi:putative membrane protein